LEILSSSGLSHFPVVKHLKALGLRVLLLVLPVLIGTVSLSAERNFAQASNRRYEGPMIDAHAHAHFLQWSGSLQTSDWGSEWMVEMMKTFRQLGVERVVFFGGTGVLEAHRLRPSEIIPSVFVPYMNWTISPLYVDTALKQGFMWVGEAVLRHWGATNTPADHPAALQIYDVCAKYKVPITIHQDSIGFFPGAYQELERALVYSSNCIFVFHGWCYGWYDKPTGQLHLTTQDLDRLLGAHPNLYLELAGQLESTPGPPWTEQTFVGGSGTAADIFAYPDGRIREEWRNLFEKYPDRIMNGFDLYVKSAYTLEGLRRRVDYWRNLLGQIDQQAAEKIAYKNVERLLGIKRFSDLQGAILNASAGTVYFVRTGNMYDDSALGFIYSKRVNPQNIIIQTDSTKVNQATGAPLFTGNMVLFGGRAASKVVKYYEDGGYALVTFSANATHYRFMKGSTPVYSVATSTYTPSKADYFVVQVYMEGSRTVFSMWGFEKEGTYASGIYFADTVYPNLATYTQGFYVCKWTDLNNDGIQQSNEISVVASGT